MEDSTTHPDRPCRQRLLLLYLPGKEIMTLELHGLSDASFVRYACVVYLGVIYTDTTIQTILVFSNTKVAPLKTITTPKLELSAAVLLAKTLSYVAKQLQLSVSEAFAWTDSSIVLSWIHTLVSRLKVFRVKLSDSNPRPSTCGLLETRTQQT